MKKKLIVFYAFLFVSNNTFCSSREFFKFPRHLREYRIAEFVNNIRKFGQLDKYIGNITLAPNHPVKIADRYDVYKVNEKRQAQKTHSVIKVEDKKFNYTGTFLAVTLRSGICTKTECSQQTIATLSDINALKPQSPTTDLEAQSEEKRCGKMYRQKFESIDVDVADKTPGVLSACNDCEKVELIFKEKQ